MGYTTEFDGEFKLNKKLDKKTLSFLRKLASTRRMARNLDAKKYGIEGEFYVEGTGDFGQDRDPSIIDYNRPPKTQPSLWCQWVPNKTGTAIHWDGNEKFYDYVQWIEYVIARILMPKGYSLTGDVYWVGEDSNDRGIISITDNVVSVKTGRVQVIYE